LCLRQTATGEALLAKSYSNIDPAKVAAGGCCARATSRCGLGGGRILLPFVARLRAQYQQPGEGIGKRQRAALHEMVSEHGICNAGLTRVRVPLAPRTSDMSCFAPLDEGRCEQEVLTASALGVCR
jgi:hypothetical protein